VDAEKNLSAPLYPSANHCYGTQDRQDNGDLLVDRGEYNIAGSDGIQISLA
jgi:hypothetical protein